MRNEPIETGSGSVPSGAAPSARANEVNAVVNNQGKLLKLFGLCKVKVYFKSNDLFR